MAERYIHTETPHVNDVLEGNINKVFNRLIDRLNRRREQLISQSRQRHEDKINAVQIQTDKLKQLTDMKTDIGNRKVFESLQSMQVKMLGELEARIKDTQVERNVEIFFKCDTHDFEEAISKLGELLEKDVTVPNYPALTQPSISVGKEGTAEGELKWPGGLACDENSQLIYVGNGGCVGLGSGRITVFTMKGEYIGTFCEGLFNEPVGIAIDGAEVFVSDSHLHCLFKLKLPSFELVKKVGSNGSGVGEFDSLQKLSIDRKGSVFVADCGNNRVVVLSKELEHLQHIQHETMKFPYDVKVDDNKVYVLSFTDDPCIHVFSLSGEKMSSFISCGTSGNTQVKQCYSFCFDKKHNIIIADHSARNIKVFSQGGELLHVLGNNLESDTIKPSSVLVTGDNKIVCVSSSTQYALHIF